MVNRGCDICKGTGKRLISGIEVVCKCQGLELYGDDIIKNSTSKTNLDVSSSSRGSSDCFYTDYANGVESINLTEISNICDKYALDRGLIVVGKDNYIKLASMLLERSKNGELLKRSVLLCATTGFGIDVLGNNIIKNYRNKGLRVPDLLTTFDLMQMRDKDLESWVKYISYPTLVIKLAGSAINWCLTVLLHVINIRSAKGLPTIFLSTYSISEMVTATRNDNRCNYSQLMGLLNSNVYDPFNTVLSADVYYKVGDMGEQEEI